jgi:hypothetical protein
MGKKHFAVTAAVLAAGIGFNGAAEAQVFRPPAGTASTRFFYGTAGYDHYSASGSSLDGGGLGLGWRIGRYLGLEGGGQYLRSSGVDVINGYAEAQLLLPIGSRASIFAAAGGAYAHASTSVLGGTVTSNSTGYRAGFGLEYWLAPRWGARFTVHRQNTGGVIDNYGVSLAYKF